MCKHILYYLNFEQEEHYYNINPNYLYLVNSSHKLKKLIPIKCASIFCLIILIAVGCTNLMNLIETLLNLQIRFFDFAGKFQIKLIALF